MKLRLDYDLPCTARQFWELYFDEDYTVRLHEEGLGSTSIVIVEQQGDLTSGLTRILRYGRRIDAPGPAKRLFGQEIVTTDHSSFDPTSGKVSFTVTPGTLTNQTSVEGSIVVDPAEGGCHELFTMEAKVRVFGAGPVAERFIVAETRDVQNRSVDFMRAKLLGGG